MAYTAHSNRAAQVPVLINHAGGQTERRINQRTPPDQNGFMSLGEYTFDGNAQVWVLNRDTDGYVVVDAVQFLPR